MCNKKYEFTGETKELCGHILHRVRAVVSFAYVRAGEIGGWIETESNLSHDGDAWVCGDTKVYGNAKVYDDAKVCGNAEVYGDAWVCGNAKVYDDAWVCGNAKVCGDAWVCGDAEVYGNAEVCGNAWVYGNAKVCDDAKVYDDAKVCGNAKVYGNAEVCGNAEVYGNAKVCGDAWVCGDTKVYGNAEVCGNAEVYGNAKVEHLSDYIVIKNCWSSMRWFTYTRSNKKWKVGCFYGTGEELIKKAYADSEKIGKCYEAIVKAVKTIEAAMQEEV